MPVVDVVVVGVVSVVLREVVCADEVDVAAVTARARARVLVDARAVLAFGADSARGIYFLD